MSDRIRPFFRSVGFAALLEALLTSLACNAAKSQEREEAQLLSLLAKVDAYRLAQFAPQNVNAYARIFGENITTATGSSGFPYRSSVYEAQQIPVAAICPIFPEALRADPNLQKTLQDYYDKTEPVWRMVAQAIAGGYCSDRCLRPNSLSFDRYTPGVPPFWIHAFLYDNVQKAFWLLAAGRTDEAIAQLAFGLKLGERFLGGVSGCAVCAAAIQSACIGYDYLLWRPLPPQTARRALESLRGYTLPVRKQAGIAESGQALLFAGLLRPLGAKGFHRLLNPVMLYLVRRDNSWMPFPELLTKENLTRPENQRWLEWAAKQAEEGRSTSYFLKLTTLPAFRKRLQHILDTEPYFQGPPRTPIFSEAELKDLPPEVQILLHDPLGPGWWKTEAALHFLTATTRLELVRIAFAARVFRDQTGNWPVNVAELQAADLISTPTAAFPTPITIAELYSKRGLAPELADAAVATALVNTVDWKRSRYLAHGPLALSRRGEGTVFSIRFDNVSKANAEMFARALNIFAPLVENARVTSFTFSPQWTRALARGPYAAGEQSGAVFPPKDGPVYSEATIEAEFKRPKKLWWVYSWGPDGKDNGGIVHYDPAVSRFAPGDIGQVVGWE